MCPQPGEAGLVLLKPNAGNTSSGLFAASTNKGTWFGILRKTKAMLLLLLILAGLLGFALFFKAIDFFEKI